jgi:PEP-CTERM motif
MRQLRRSLLQATRVLLILACISGVSYAEMIAVTNFSFEDPITDLGGTGTITGWTRTDATDGAAGVWRPDVPFRFFAIPDGEQIAFLQSGAIYQVLSDVLTANTLYELQVDVGETAFEPLLPGQYAVQLRAGGTLLAESSSPDPAFKSFSTTTVAFFAAAGNPLLGQNLEIRLVDLDPDIFRSDPQFDNVRLSRTAVNPVPEPNTLAMLAGAGIVAWIGTRRRREDRRERDSSSRVS